MVSIDSLLFNVIIHKLRGEVSQVEQDTIVIVSAVYLRFIIIFLRNVFNFFFHSHFMQLFSADATIFLKKLKKIFFD